MKPEVVIQTPCPPNMVCACSNEVVVDGEVAIPPHKPEKERITSFRVWAEVTSWEPIPTPLGTKIVVSGLVHIGIEYVANLPEQPVHFAHFDLAWHTFFLCDVPIRDVVVCIEYVDYTQLDHRRISKMIVLFVCSVPCPPPCPPCPPH